MGKRLIGAIIVWIVVAIILWLLAALLLTMNTDVTTTIGAFLDRFNVVIGFLVGLWYFFVGYKPYV